jgi:hypothetical protein
MGAMGGMTGNSIEIKPRRSVVPGSRRIVGVVMARPFQNTY